MERLGWRRGTGERGVLGTWGPCISKTEEARSGNMHHGVSLRCERGRRRDPVKVGPDPAASQGPGREVGDSTFWHQPEEGRLFSPLIPLLAGLAAPAGSRGAQGLRPSSGTAWREGTLASAHSWGSGFPVPGPTSPFSLPAQLSPLEQGNV